MTYIGNTLYKKAINIYNNLSVNVYMTLHQFN